MRRLERIARTSGRILAVLGLAMIYVSLLVSLLEIAAPREPVLKAGFIVATVGCLVSLGALIWPRGDKGRVVFEATLGMLCLPPGVVGSFLAHGDEVGLQVFWLAITILFLGSAVALVVQATRVRQESERWRNTGQGE